MRSRRAPRALASCVLAFLLASCSGPPKFRPLESYPKPKESDIPSIDRLPPIQMGDGPFPAYCLRVLSIDGGGMRGIIPAMLLAELEKRSGRPVSALFDMITGTSAGGILALGLSKSDPANPERPHYSAAQMVELFEREGTAIFPGSSSLWRSFLSIFRPKYREKGLERVLKRYFGDARFMDIVPHLEEVTVTTYEIEERGHVFLRAGDFWIKHLPMREMARATSAAPTYFPPARLAVHPEYSSKGYLALIDGGVFANNPAPHAFQRTEGHSWGKMGRGVLLVSLGTGIERLPIRYEKAWGWGLWNWTKPLISIVFSDPGVDHAMERAMQGKGRYERFQPELPPGRAGLDAAGAESVAEFKKAAQRLIEDKSDMLDYLAEELSRERFHSSARCFGPSAADSR